MSGPGVSDSVGDLGLSRVLRAPSHCLLCLFRPKWPLFHPWLFATDVGKRMVALSVSDADRHRLLARSHGQVRLSGQRCRRAGPAQRDVPVSGSFSALVGAALPGQGDAFPLPFPEEGTFEFSEGGTHDGEHEIGHKGGLTDEDQVLSDELHPDALAGQNLNE